jgi:hypothetical protein
VSATIPPAPPPPPTLPSGGAAQAVVSVVAADPKVAQALAAGQVLEAVIQAKAARGMVEVALPAGSLMLKLPPELMNLGPGARLNLQVLAGDGNLAFQMRLLAVNGRLLLPSAAPFIPGGNTVQQPAAPLPGQPQATAPRMAAVPPGATAAPAPAGIAATVLRPAVTPGAASAPQVAGNAGLPADLAPGTRILVRIAVTALPGQPLPALPGQPPTPLQPASPQAPATSGVVPPQPQPGAPAPVQGQPQPAPPQASTAPQPQQPAQPVLSAPAPPPVLTGTVTAHPPSGQAVVQTPIGTLAVPSPVDLPIGSRVVLDVVGRPEPPLPAPPAAAKPEGLTQAGWPALAEAADTLASADSKAAEHLLRLIPQANPRLAASMVMFTGALRSGEVRALIGEAVARGLEKAGKRGLVDRLSGDVEKLATESTRTLGGGEWRGYTMPFLHGAEIDPIRLYVRTLKDDERQGRPGGGQGDGERFILDINMRRLGRIQLDGMVRRDEKSFDLIMRTQEPLPQDMRRDILAIFAENCDACGTKGVVVFQSGRFVDLPPDAAPTTLTV